MTTSDEKQEPTLLRRAVRLLTGAYFVQRALLLVLAAFLSGLVVPLIFKSIDQSRERQQFVYRAQAKLFDDVSEVLLTYQTLALDVTWYGTKEARNPDLQRRAFEKYSDAVAGFQAKLALQVARSRTLASPAVSAKIGGLLEDLLKEQDLPMNKLWTECETRCDWAAQHDKNVSMGKRVTVLIEEIAHDLGLVRINEKGGA